MATHQIIIRLAREGDLHHINTITAEIESSAQIRSTGICKRSPAQLEQCIKERTAVIAVTNTNEWVGFCYIKAWDDGRFVSTCALIVSPQHRKSNVATRLKEKAFDLARTKYPGAKLFGLTTSLAVMKINSRLGFKPVTYSEITTNEAFWDACKSCPNYGILENKARRACLCTAMLFDAVEIEQTPASCNRHPKTLHHPDETWLQKKLATIEAVG